MKDLPFDDDAFLAAARAAHDELDPPPERLREAAIRAAGWDHGLDLLVSLAHDSQFADAGLRSTAAPRDLVFEADDISIELMLEPGGSDPTTMMIRGEIDPVPDAVFLRSPGVPDRSVDVDEAGRFEAKVDVDVSLVSVVAKVGDREIGTALIAPFE
jgi:hypothetical protein